MDTMKSTKIKVVVVEDDNDLRDLLGKLISNEDDMELIATFHSGDAFVESFAQIDMDVVLLDINMRGRNGIQCVKECKPQKAQVQYLMISVFDQSEFIFDALCAGATGYITKSSRSEEIMDCIRSIHSGGAPMSANIARLVVGSFSQSKEVKKDELVTSLTKRECEILEGLSKGLNYKKIAAQCFISPETVRTHIRNIYEKLQVNSKVEAINKFKGI
jgi:DNA-binding NarL/FixJ family response regulator